MDLFTWDQKTGVAIACCGSPSVILVVDVAKCVQQIERNADMEFKELIEARRSVRKYVASEISKAEVEEIVGEVLKIDVLP